MLFIVITTIQVFMFSPRVYCDSETDEDERDEKDIVRGYVFAEYHADVYDKTESEVTSSGLDCECLGGGRIEHKPGEKYIKVTLQCILSPPFCHSALQVYGYSMGFGRANHARAVEILKTKYKDYKIEWSDEGY